MSPNPSMCPACGEAAMVAIRSWTPFPILSCSSCTFLRASAPIASSPSAGAHSVMTAEDYTAGMLETHAERAELYAALARRRYAYLRGRLGRERFSLLEVGCGVAGMAETLASLGVTYTGIDIDHRVVDAARRRGANVRHCDLFELGDDARFDAITFSQVLEHITAPRAFLCAVSRLLNDDGIVICDVPNEHSLSSRLHRALPLNRRRSGAIEYPHHLFAYTATAIRRLFASLFRDVEVFSATSEDPLWGQAVRYGTLPLKAYAKLSNVFGWQSLLVVVGRNAGSPIANAEDRALASTTNGLSDRSLGTVTVTPGS